MTLAQASRDAAIHSRIESPGGEWRVAFRERDGTPIREKALRTTVSKPGDNGMTTVAVVAHARKSFGGGLPELREVSRGAIP